MKALVAVALIVCGTGLLALPYVYHMTIMTRVMDTMIAMDKPVNLKGDLPKYADVACMLAGGAMVLVGAIMGWRQEPTPIPGKVADER